jgi:hypothetical protein
MRFVPSRVVFCAVAAATAAPGCSSDNPNTSKGGLVNFGGSDVAPNFVADSEGDDAVPSGESDSGSTEDTGAAAIDAGSPLDAKPTGPAVQLCNPCSASDQCQKTGDETAVCVKRGALGNFCGTTCADSAACPEGFTCATVQGVEGTTAKQCVPKDDSDKLGECTCSAEAVDKELATACAKTTSDKDGNVVNTCKGTRKCTKLGLTKCDAPTPAAEVCDGVDNDCDGATDEETCDDKNLCTSDVCAASKCVHTPTTGGPCDDGDLCTIGELCNDGVCEGGNQACECKVDADCQTGNLCDGVSVCEKQGNATTCKLKPNSAVNCSVTNDTTCAKSVCDPATGKCFMTAVAGGSPCDDGDACTASDSCSQGLCKAGASACECQADVDCKSKEDGNACNGTLVCDKVTNKCQLNPASVIKCTASPNTCQENACSPATGKCAVTNVANGTVCSDGDACTANDKCALGKCAAGKILCDDGNPCTGDACTTSSGKCIYTVLKNGSKCDDGVCDKGKCTGGSKVSIKAACVADAFVEGSSKMGKHKYLILAQSGGYAKKRSLLKFDLSGVPKGKKVSTATMKVYVDYWHVPSSVASKEPAIARPIEVFSVLKAWTESGVTSSATGTGAKWSKKLLATDDTDAANASADTQTWAAGSKGWKSFDVTALAQLWVSDPTKNHGVLLKAQNEDKKGREPRCWSRDAVGKAAFAPHLTVQYQ